MIRYAIIKNARPGDAGRKEVEAYLPDNYKVIHVFESADGYTYDADDKPVKKLRTHTCYVIEGEDVAGWTLEGYVQPRLGSGLFYATEIDLSHPVMKEIRA